MLVVGPNKHGYFRLVIGFKEIARDPAHSCRLQRMMLTECPFYVEDEESGGDEGETVDTKAGYTF